MSAGKRRKARALRAVAVKGGTADVYIEGVIGEDVMAADVREQLARADGKPVNVHFNTEGGIVTEGMAIYAALRAYPGRKTGIVEGLAASMGSVCLMACDERIVSKGAFVMIHNPSGGAAGEAKDLRSTADLLDKIREELLDIYEARTGRARADLEALVNAETYFTAEEAVAEGIADTVEDSITARIKLDAVARLNPKNIPEALRALAQKESSMTAEEEKEMRAKLKALEEENASLKAKAEDDGEEDDGAEGSEEEPKHDTHAEDDDKEEARALARDVLKLTGAKTLGEARGRVMALAHKAGSAGRSARAEAVSALIDAGKLAPARKSWAMKASAQTFDAYCDAVKDIAPVVGKKHQEPAAKGAAPADELTEDEKVMSRLLGRSAKDIIASRGAEVRVGLRNLSEEN